MIKGKTMGRCAMAKNLVLGWVMVLIPLMAWAGQPANPELCKEGKELLSYFEGIYGKKILAGYNVYPHTPDDYQQTGRQAAIWGRDIKWLGDVTEVVSHVRSHGNILTLHWHWFFGGDSAWKRERKSPVDLEKVVTPGTAEHDILLKELAATADVLEQLQKAGIVVLWRPLHEIDGGWFWWTDTNHPENTAELWRIMFRYFTEERKLNNLIWVYSAGVGDLKKKPPEWRRRFYPGANYVDISGIDIYGVDPQNDETPYWDYFKAMEQVSPGKMLALCECDAIPNPDKMVEGKSPTWLYALPWWGCPHPRRSVPWARFTMGHDCVVTLDELPTFTGQGYCPQVGILEPSDDGSAWFPVHTPVIKGYAVSRGSTLSRVEFLAGDRVIGSLEQPPANFAWTWPSDLKGTFDLVVKATDLAGRMSTSNRIHLAVGVQNVARGKPVHVSSGEHPEGAVDGSYYSSWRAAKEAEEAWLEIDLQRPTTISQINVVWGWKIHPARFAVEVTSIGPTENERGWQTVCVAEDLPWVTWKATHRLVFSPTTARFVRIHAFQRANRQTWSGYDLAEVEIPVPVQP
jgi:mannan endo-1,4-beta-mannosidase